MNKKPYTLVSVILGAVLSLSSILTHELNSKPTGVGVKNITSEVSMPKVEYRVIGQTLGTSASFSLPFAKSVSIFHDTEVSRSTANVTVKASPTASEVAQHKPPATTEQTTAKVISTPKKTTSNSASTTKKVTTTAANSTSAAKKVTTAVKSTKQTSLSRGGQPPKITAAKAEANANSASKKSVELLDWWKEARYAFPAGAVATITDVYTGKTFKAKRTMGTNHADAEALTKEDTSVIKSIWGGFSWDRRPVIVSINGRRLAASMSAMPHAGIDSSPAYITVNNRSDDYGRGENLDVIKNNGMDGHFDIHFLNSTRHKDGKEDPEHQAMVMKAARK